MRSDLIQCGAGMLGEKVLSVENGEEWVDVMEVCSNQVIAHLGLRECEDTLALQVFEIIRIQKGDYAIWKEEVTTLLCAVGLANICNGTNALGVSYNRFSDVNTISPTRRG